MIPGIFGTIHMILFCVFYLLLLFCPYVFSFHTYYWIDEVSFITLPFFSLANLKVINFILYTSSGYPYFLFFN